jgi:rSAM/selenodomain-associated transferase 1
MADGGPHKAPASPQRRLCVFARAPDLGRVKRRLAAELGDLVALDAHIRLVEDTLTRCSGRADWTTELWIADGEAAHPTVSEWCRRFRVSFARQEGGDLGARMHHALSRTIDQGALPVLIGCDCPDIDAAYVSAAFAGLENASLVVGPAEDGGYGLIGLRSAVPELFNGLPWGGGDVLEETLRRAAGLGLSVRLLDRIWDVDSAADWRRYVSRS